MHHVSRILNLAASQVLMTLYATALALAATSVQAQERFKYNFQNPPEIKSVYKQAHNIDVGDVPGYVLRLSALQTVYPSTGELHEPTQEH